MLNLARNRLALIFALALPLVASAVGPAAAATRAVVVGIDHYQHGRSLQGAVADADDIATALRSLAITPVVLVNQQAHRTAILTALDRMVAEAAAGDTVIFTYAGHGGTQKAADPSTEPTGFDQVLLLGGFTPERNDERILDDEIFAWTSRAGAKGLRTVVVFDACHSGTLYRQVDRRAGRLGFRSQNFAISGADLLAAVPRRPSADIAPGTFSYAASQDQRKIVEIEFGNRVRGALSIAFAEALRGKADNDRDQVLTHGELAHYLLGRVRMLGESSQEPDFAPTSHWPERLIAMGSAEPAQVPASAPARDALKLRVLGASQAQIDQLSAEWRDRVILVGDPDQMVDLVWDAGRSEAVSGIGDVVATNLKFAQLAGLIEKWTALRRLRTVSPGAPLVMRVIPDDTAHREGHTIGVSIDQIGGRALTLFALQADGSVSMLYPRGRDPATVTDQFWVNNFKVGPPFGADHLVAVVTQAPATTLQAVLHRLHRRAAAEAAVDASLTALGDDPRAQIGLQVIVTTAGP